MSACPLYKHESHGSSEHAQVTVGYFRNPGALRQACCGPERRRAGTPAWTQVHREDVRPILVHPSFVTAVWEAKLLQNALNLPIPIKKRSLENTCARG